MSINDEDGNMVQGYMLAKKFVEHFEKFLGTTYIVETISDPGSLFVNKLNDEDN